MAIRKFSVLKTSEIAEAPFRSLQEIEEYLQTQVKEKLDELDALLRQYQLQFSRSEVKANGFSFKINKDPGKQPKRGKFNVDQIDKVVIPDPKKLRQQFELVDEYTDMVESLETTYNMATLKWAKARGSQDTIKKIKDMHRQAKMKVDKALQFLERVAMKHEPAAFKILVEQTMELVQKELAFSDSDSKLYVTENKEGHLTFTHYVCLVGLVDDTGSAYPEFYLVFTCILRPSEDKKKVQPVYYVTVMHEFVPPTRIDLLGREVDGPQRAAAMLHMQLELENVSNSIGTLPHNIDPSKITKDKFSVGNLISEIKVTPNQFRFEFLTSVGEAKARAAGATIYQELKASFLTHLKSVKMKGRMAEEGNRFVAVFSITDLPKGDKVSTTDLDFLQNYFGLSDVKLRRIVQILNKDD